MRIRRDCRGASIVTYCIALTVLIAAVSLVADIGLIVLQKNKVMNAVDASALAGAQELIYNPSHAASKAAEYIQKNGIDPSEVEIEVSGTSLRVTAKDNVNFIFARILGFFNTTVSSTARAVVLPVSGISGVRPFAIEDQELLFGETYILKTGGGGGHQGNYGGLELGGAGANVYYQNIVHGYGGRLYVGDYIDTEPGNMSGPTINGIETLLMGCTHYPPCTHEHFVPGCSRVISVVIVDSLDVNGRATVQIVGFASFFLEGVGGHGNQSYVTGKFVRSITPGAMNESQNDYGLYGVRLMQ